MPKIKIEKVISFSSEDPIHIANNILSNDPAKKWKCQTAGEKSANLVLQLEEAVVISNIDIGNEHSAYIEVLVSRSGSDESYQVLLVMSSFMTPLESRQSQNVNKVRMFTNDQLSAPERDEKWDRVKIVCTQPFNRHVQYGLSFVTFHTKGKEEGNVQTPHIGKFTLRPESPNNIKVGGLFERKRESQEKKPLTAAAAIREASLNQYSPSPKKIKLPETVTSASTSVDENIANLSRKRDEIFYTKDDEQPDEKIDFIMEQKKLEKEKVEIKDTKDKKLKEKETTETSSKKDVIIEQKKLEKEKVETKDTKDKKVKVKETTETNSKKDIDKNLTPSPRAGTSKDKTASKKRKSDKVDDTPHKKKKKQLKKPFHQLFSDVTIVISGIQNPERGNVRAMALTMGGKYKGDWDNTCTHLICAFTNTPKFARVKGKGKIVTKNWVLDCYNERKRLPWRRYALDKKDKNQNESEEEILEEIDEPEEVSDDYEDNRNIKNDSDTEEEIEKINQLQLDTKDNETQKIDVDNQNNTNGCSPTRNAFDCDTDEEVNSLLERDDDYPPLPDFFQGKIFYIDNNLTDSERKTLLKYITACNGMIKTSVEDTVNCVITTEEYKLELEEVPSEAALVHPNFVYECFNSKKLLPFHDFEL